MGRQALLIGAFAYSGQVCISVQRMFVHRSRWDEFMDRFVDGRQGRSSSATRWIPRRRSGPWSTSRRPARRALGPRSRRAKAPSVLPGGKADGAFFPPTIITDAAEDGAGVLATRPSRPLVVAFPFDDFDEAIREVNDSFYGLQTGVFTNDLAHAWQAFEELEVGGVIVNDVPTYRIDHMPYGGVKDSGLGREGLRWAIEDMTELRIMVLAPPG